MTQGRKYTSKKVGARPTLSVCPGDDGFLALYLGDGPSFDYRRGEFMRVNIAWNNRRRLSLRLAKGSKFGGPAKRSIVVQIASESASRELTCDSRQNVTFVPLNSLFDRRYSVYWRVS